jgi:GT2 family glycosyltransferase
MKQVDISVVVPTYNNAEMLRGALSSLICQETEGAFSYEVVVTDDGSTDHTGEVVQEVAAGSRVPIRYVRGAGGGVAVARNMGVAEARGRWIAFFDDDQLADADWLKNLVTTALERGADCVSGTGLLDLPQGHLSRLGPLCRSILGEGVHSNGATRLRGKCLPGTGNLLISRRVFDAIGLFDTSMLWGGEDTDILLRARASGFDIWVTPNAIMHHLILPYRTEPVYLRWVALRGACALARIHYKGQGPGRMLLLCVARIGKTLLVNMPRLLLAYMKRNKAEILDRQCMVSHAIGYMHTTLFLIAPRVFTQARFFARLEFRKKRTFT